MPPACGGRRRPKRRVALGRGCRDDRLVQTMALARRRSGRLRSRRDSSDPPQHQGWQAAADSDSAEEAGMPTERIVTDKLASYGAARREIMPAVEHRSHKGLNNRAENSHLSLRKRERVMQRFRSPGDLQRFASVFSAVRNLFVPARSKHSAIAVNLHRLEAMAH